MEKQELGGGPPATNILSPVLTGMVVAAVVAGIFLGLGILWVAAYREEGLGLLDWAGALACFVAGAAVGSLLWAAEVLVQGKKRELAGQARLLAAIEAAGTLRPAAGSPAPARSESGPDLKAVLEQLVELNTNLLLSEPQRQTKREASFRSAMERLTGEVERALAGENFIQADRALSELGRVAPQEASLESLRRKVAVARQGAEKRDLQEGTKRCEDLMALSSFDQAEAIARDLAGRYPGSSDAAALLGRIAREGRAFAEDQRKRMYAELQNAAGSRQWRKAMTAAESLLQKYPDSPEAHAVRAQLGTLQDNARIEEVRELRDSFRDLIGRKRYSQALEQAEEVIRRFPESAAADELRQQMDRLRELAK